MSCYPESSTNSLASALTLLASALKDRPPEIREKVLKSIFRPKLSEHDREALSKRERRSESARIAIPECKNPTRREKCLDDPERFLKTYFPTKYRLDFGRDHRFMLEAIVDIAARGGNQAVAAPRGRGKSEIAKGAMVYVVLKGLTRFPLPVAATTKLAGRFFRDFKHKLATTDLLLEDFPEVCYPIRALQGAPQRAAKQHVDGQLTNIVWTGEELHLPHVPGSIYGGVKMTYYGLDSAFRGANIGGDRPDFVLIDDPETRESAKSPEQIEDRKAILERDIQGLAGQDRHMGICVLTTVQNSYCLSAQLTDRERMQAYNGVRFGMIEKWPDNIDLWDEYISIRRKDKEDGDKDARNAVAFYIKNQDAMNAGVQMISPHYKPVSTKRGEQLVYSAIQQAYNAIADTSYEAYKQEFQNEPEQEEQAETIGLTAGRVASRISGHLQGVVAPEAEKIAYGIDVGKQWCHWVKTAWRGNAVGDVVDYGVIEVYGVGVSSSPEAIEKAQLAALHAFRSEVIAPAQCDAAMIDSGMFTQAVYSFVREVGAPYYATKGWDPRRFRMPEHGDAKLPFLECWAHRLERENLWLYNVNTEWWKEWLQQRFITPTFDDSNRRVDGSLALFATPNDKKKHLSFTHHIVAEERRTLFVEGKGNVSKWMVLSKNNHYLDALALACCGAGCLGVRLLPKTQSQVAPARQAAVTQRFTTPDGKPFLITERK